MRKAVPFLTVAMLAALAAGTARLHAQPETPAKSTASLGSSPTVELEAASDRMFYREGGASEVYVEARIRPIAPPADVAAPPGTFRNIALVLDRSGSMAGEPIQSLRQAVAASLDTLAGRDVVSIVLFGSEVETLIEAQRRDQAATDLDTALARIEPAGGSALYDALNQGAAQLRRYATPSTIDHLVLVTDGPPTKGPREADDFARLAEVFSREGITISTIGLGEDFEEDVLARLARIGNGRFRYVDTPARLGDALSAELAPLRTVVAHDAVLTIEFKSYCKDVDAHGWQSATVEKNSVTYQFPHLFAGQELSVLASGTVDSFFARNQLRDLATVRLRWRGTDDEIHETTRSITVHFSSSTADIRDTTNVSVFRAAASTLISEGMQEAIEYLDKGDFRRALRTLRQTRTAAADLNYNLEDPAITAMIQKLDTYLAEVRTRGLNLLDRKILRSGLFNQFETPTADEDTKD